MKTFVRILPVLCLCVWTVALHAQVFQTSEQVYRLPYANGAIVQIGNDHWTHTPRGRIDMTSQGISITIVAAADGTIEAIVDDNTESCSDGPPCTCSQYNNYVWISHDNGEWTKYTHFQTGSVTDLGHQVGDFVTAGTALGLEGDIGCASGIHLHFQVAFPTTTTDPPFNAAGGEMIEGNEIDRIPVMCGLDDHIFNEGDVFIAGPCTDCSSSASYSVDELQNDEVEVRLAQNLVSTSGTAIMESGSAALFLSGGAITFSPGFHGQAGVRFNALIRGCHD